MDAWKGQWHHYDLFFRVEELTMQWEASFDPSANLSFADVVVVDDHKNPTFSRLT